MNHLQTNTSGLDCVIKTLQTDIYTELLVLYPTLTIDGFGRAYRIAKEGNKNYVPSVFDEEGKEYIPDMYLNDNKDLTFFFIDGENHKTEDGVVFTSTLKVVFHVNLSKIDVVSRADAKVHKEVANLIRLETNGDLKIEGLEKGVPTVFRGFDTSKITFTDMHPYHIFAVIGTVNYYINNKC